MGSCVSTTRRRRRTRKLSTAARKFRRKVSAAIADSPIVRAGDGDAASCLARHEVVHVEAPVSIVTLHLTQLQWQHSQTDDAGSVIREEAWYDSLSILDSDDDLDNDFASVSGDPLPDLTGGATCLLDTVHRLRSIANAEASQDDPPDRGDDSNAAAASSSSSWKAEECCSSSVMKESQSAMLCSPQPFPASIPSNKVQPMPIVGVGVSPHHQKKKSAVVRLSFRRRSYEGDEMTEMSGSTEYLYRPRAGLSVPCSAGHKLSDGCWSVLEPSVFRVRGEGFFKLEPR